MLARRAIGMLSACSFILISTSIFFFSLNHNFPSLPLLPICLTYYDKPEGRSFVLKPFQGPQKPSWRGFSKYWFFSDGTGWANCAPSSFFSVSNLTLFRSVFLSSVHANMLNSSIVPNYPSYSQQRSSPGKSDHSSSSYGQWPASMSDIIYADRTLINLTSSGNSCPTAFQLL